MRHRLLGEDADVHRVAIALDAGHAGALRAALADALAAIGLRDEAVERRWLAGVALRPIDFQVTTSLVQFVLHRIGGRDLDEGLHHSGRIAGIDAVPRMRLEHRLQQLVEIVAHAKLRTRDDTIRFHPSRDLPAIRTCPIEASSNHLSEFENSWRRKAFRPKASRTRTKIASFFLRWRRRALRSGSGSSVKATTSGRNLFSLIAARMS